MTHTEYQAYEKAVASFLADNHVKPGCYSNIDSENPEPFFSWRPCECCGSYLGGNQETYSFAIKPETLADEANWQTFEADICTDCVYYLAYGQLDDMTMLEIEATR